MRRRSFYLLHFGPFDERKNVSRVGRSFHGYKQRRSIDHAANFRVDVSHIRHSARGFHGLLFCLVLSGRCSRVFARASSVVGQPETGRDSVAKFLVGVMIAWTVHFHSTSLVVGSPTMWWVLFLVPYYAPVALFAMPSVAHLGVIMYRYRYLLNRERRNVENRTTEEGSQTEAEQEILLD